MPKITIVCYSSIDSTWAIVSPVEEFFDDATQ